MNQHSHHETWESHWAIGSGDSGSFFGRLSSFVRRQILSRAVRHYAERYFDGSGVYVECGCGTAQSSSRIPAGGRRLVALDFSTAALRSARQVPGFRDFIQGDILRLPFAEGSVAGIWSLGVLEHFDAEAGRQVLEEFRRVLRPGGVALLFWPPEYGASRWLLAPIEWIRSRWSGRTFRFFPDEVNRLRSKAQARDALAGAGLEAAAVDFTPRDAFIHMVVVARKPA
jgi:SAM-dependent methyltransferase